MFIRKILLILIVSLIIPAHKVYASECKWINTVGEAAVENLTAEGARNLALSRARIKAVESVSTISVSGSSLVRDLSIANEFILTLSQGYLRDEKVLEWDVSSFQEKKDHPPVILYAVKLKSCVVDKKGGDPYFRVKGEMDRNVYQHGESAHIKAVCSRGCFLSIVNVTASGRMKLLLPNSFQGFIKLSSGEKYSFPPKGLTLEMRTMKRHKRDAEAMLLIATKESFDLLSLIDDNGYMKQKDFYDALLSLPPETRTEKIIVYEVRK